MDVSTRTSPVYTATAGTRTAGSGYRATVIALLVAILICSGYTAYVAFSVQRGLPDSSQNVPTAPPAGSDISMGG